MALPSQDRIADTRLAADATVRPDDRATDHRIFVDLRLPSDHGVGADLRAGLDQRALVDEAGSFDGRAVLDACIGRNPGARRSDVAERLSGIPTVHDVAMDLGVLLGRADVDPVPLVDVANEGFAAFHQRRKVAPLDGPRDVARDAVEGVRFEYVDPGVDVVRRDLVSAGLLEEAADVSGIVCLDEPVRRRIVDRGQDDRRARVPLPVKSNDAAEIDLRQHVAVEHDNRFRQLIAGVFDGARGSKRRGLDDVADLDSDVRPIPEDLLDPARLIIQTENDFIDLGHLLEKIDLVVQKWAIEDRNDRLWRVNGEWPESGSLAPGQKDRLHDDQRSYTHGMMG